MKYVQINSFYNGSTGTIMRNLHKRLAEEGHDSYIFWGRRHDTISDHEACCASSLEVYVHGALSRVTDRAGFYSKSDTAKLLARLDEIDPDVVHLHNIHGYYINIEMLFAWLARHRCEVRWTLHDCWAFTGHCSHFDFAKCDKWKTRCHHCPQKGEYPKSFLCDSSERNYLEKKRLFTSLSPSKVTLITPSQWLADLVNQSFLSSYRVIVENNKINTDVFKPTESDFRERYGMEDKKVILGVASPWTERKGLPDFFALRKILDDSFEIVLVGLSKQQLRQLQPGMLGFARTDSQQDLAELYSMADVFFNPTKEENYPTVNLEAEACGTPVVTYDTGGSRETLHMMTSKVCPVASVTCAASCIVDVINHGR